MAVVCEYEFAKLLRKKRTKSYNISKVLGVLLFLETPSTILIGVSLSDIYCYCDHHTLKKFIVHMGAYRQLVAQMVHFGTPYGRSYSEGNQTSK